MLHSLYTDKLCNLPPSLYACTHLTIILWPQLSSYCPLLLMTHLPFVIHHVPDDLEMPQVVVAQQLVLLSGVEEREILHNDGWSSGDTPIFTHLNMSTEHCH